MNKQETIIVVLLVALLVAWGFYSRPSPGWREVRPQPAAEAATNAVGQATAPAAAELTQPSVPERESEPAQTQPRPLETVVSLENDELKLAVSSWGGGVILAELKQYRSDVDKDSPPVAFDFGAMPCLSMDEASGMGPDRDYGVEVLQGGKAARLSFEAPGGIRVERDFELGEGYILRVTDRFINGGEEPSKVAAHALRLGPIPETVVHGSRSGEMLVGVDTLEDGAKGKTKYWGSKDIPSMFGYKPGMFGCSRPPQIGMPESVKQDIGSPLRWAAAKNKFFVQILTPDEPAAGGFVHAVRDVSVSNALQLVNVSAGLQFNEREVASGGEWVRKTSFYMGPKKYSLLKGLGARQSEVMQFGWLSWLCKQLLWVLNALHAVIPNYGVAIILLTLIVRGVFWPVTHKSNESMRRMQEIQPEVAKLREKFKSDAQKMNYAIMSLYKQNKVNPMMGCLPMLIQIPVFFALFTALRNAVELRYASFLWVRDLSEPEGLFRGMIPLIGSLNILPLLMTATMVWQQHLTPSSGDPQQKKMMTWMSVFFTVIFYNMSAALVLYWTVSQVVSIVQLLLQQKKRVAARA
ncbi:MAG: membrane protein insertase YidC [Lentisphaerae bacterium]|nr:membrane protein insertase YidC [Lentisphaerota bacterium]